MHDLLPSFCSAGSVRGYSVADRHEDRKIERIIEPWSHRRDGRDHGVRATSESHLAIPLSIHVFPFFYVDAVCSSYPRRPWGQWTTAIPG